MSKHEHTWESTAPEHAGRKVGGQRAGERILPLLHRQLRCCGAARVPRAMPEDEGVSPVGYGGSPKEGDAVDDDLIL